MSALYDRLGDWVNPIAIKEMRQAVKGRILTWMLILFLLAQLVIMGGGMLMTEFSGENFEAGPALLSVLLFSLLCVCLLFLPAIFGIRFSIERAQGRADLLFITDMSPYSIVWGKTLAGVALTLLLFSASMPFVTLTYLLRGIDLPSIFIMMGVNFIAVVLTIQAALLLASFPGGIISRGIRFMFGLGGAVFILSMMTGLSVAMLNEGIGSLLTTWTFWGPALTVIGFVLLAMGFIYILTAVAISPGSSNRSPVVRLYLFLLWCCTTLCFFLWYWHSNEKELLLAWLLMMLISFSVVFIFSLAERDQYGVRLRRLIPRNILLRIPAFFLYSGSAAGLLFSTLMIGLTIGVFYWACAVFSKNPVRSFDINRFDEFHLMAFTSCLYLIAYGLSALFLRRILFSKEMTNLTTVMISLIFITGGSLFPYLFAWIFIYRDIDKIPDIWSIGNPMIVYFEKTMMDDVMLFTIIWSVIAFCLNLPWFTRQIREFKPLPDEPAPVTDEQPVEETAS